MEFTNPNGSKVVFNLNDVRSCVAEGAGSYLFTRTGSGKTQVQESPATIATNSCGNIVLFTVYSPANQFNDTKQMGVNPNYVVGVVSNTSGNGVLKMITPTENFTTTSTYNAAVALLSICVSGGGGGGGSLTNTYVGFGDGLNQLDGEAGFTYDAEANRLAVDTVKTKRISSKSGPLEILNDTKFNAYPNTRDDAGSPVNFLGTDASGSLRSHPVSDLKDSLGLAIPAGRVPFGTGTGITSEPESSYNSTTNTYTTDRVNVTDAFKIDGNDQLYATDLYNVFVGGSGNKTHSGGAIANYFFGNGAGAGLTTGTRNVFLGQSAGGSNSTGAFNTYMGHSAGSGSNASYNIALGAYTAQNSAGTRSIFAGYETGYNNTGSFVTALGDQCATSNTGSDLITFGRESGRYNSGQFNTFQAYRAGFRTTGSYVQGYGVSAADSASATYLIAIGLKAGSKAAGNNSTYIGDFAGESATSNAIYNIGIGASASQFNSGGQVISIGYQSAQNNAATGIVAIGASTLKVNAGIENVAVGNGAGAANTSGGRNLYIGTSAGAANTTGGENTYIGWRAGFANNGGGNTMMGESANDQSKTADTSCVFGMQAQHDNVDGDYNTSFGALSLYSLQTVLATNMISGQSYSIRAQGSPPTDFTLLGAANNTTGTIFTYNGVAATGGGSVKANTLFPDYNTSIGFRAGHNVSTGSRNLYLGSFAGDNTAFYGLDDKLVIDNSPVSVPLIGGDFSQNRVGINKSTVGLGFTFGVDGTVEFDNLTAADGSFTNVLKRNPTTGEVGYAAASGVTALAAVGSTPNANAATLSGSTLNLEPANAANPGVVTTAAQTFSGQKTLAMSGTATVTQNLILDNTGTAAVNSAASMAQSIAGVQKGEVKTTLTELGVATADWAKVEVKAQDGGALEVGVLVDMKNAGVDNVTILPSKDGVLTTARRIQTPYSNVALTGDATLTAGYSTYVLTGTQILTDVWTITMPTSASMLDGEIITISNSIAGVSGATLQLTANSGQTLLGFTGNVGFGNTVGFADRRAIQLMFKTGGTWITLAEY